MYDPDERAEFLKEYEANLAKAMSPEGRARLIARGLDPEAEFKRVAAQKDAYLAADKDYEQAVDDHLQKVANLGDATDTLFKSLRDLVQELKRTDPLNPQLEELEDFVEALAQRVPKEPDDLSAPPS
jgi:ABC-type transporter Mla subunit MlaD